ncbi:MAG: hypothetical protein OXU23_13640 [Candidatus Poribacteria bacterium]|nr:hypothetical protein [Candidatus Poribacteria bacterium]MDE0466353.1 hypothetical protein [Candidatus Poribacteria bacterium]
MTQTQPIRGKVARILSDKALVINIGEADGVTDDMEFYISEIIPVKDPDTSIELGKIEWPIVSLWVYDVQEHITVLYSQNKILSSGEKGSFSRSLLSSSRALVNIGDPVVQVIEETE